MKPRHAAFAALDPFFELVQRGLSGLVDGEHYFDTIAENTIFEIRYDFPGWPQRIEGRDALMAHYLGYGDSQGIPVFHCPAGCDRDGIYFATSVPASPAGPPTSCNFGHGHALHDVR